MALLDLKVRVIPDMSQFKRDIQRGITGVGPAGKKPSGKGAEVAVSGFGKLLAGVAGMFAILKSLDFLLGPILRLFDIVLKAFFIPLLPLVAKLIQFFTKKGGPLQAALNAPQFKITAQDSIVEAFIKGVANVAIRVGAFFFKLGNEIGQALWDFVILPVGDFISRWIIRIGTMISNAILRGWNIILDGFNFIRNGLRDIINRIIDFVNSLIPGTRFDIGRTSTTEINQSFPISVTGNNFRSEADIRTLSDKISDQLRKKITLRNL